MGQGEVKKAQISNIDIFPTIFRYLDLEISRQIQGQSFLNVIKGLKDEHRDEIYAEVGRPIAPPPVKYIDEYDNFSKEQGKRKGLRWFLDYTCNGRCAMIKKDHFKYCYYVGDKEELYNLNEDPLEVENLANNENCEKIKLDLKNRLFNWSLIMKRII